MIEQRVSLLKQPLSSLSQFNQVSRSDLNHNQAARIEKKNAALLSFKKVKTVDANDYVQTEKTGAPGSHV